MAQLPLVAARARDLGAPARADRHRRRVRAVGPPQARPLRGRPGTRSRPIATRPRRTACSSRSPPAQRLPQRLPVARRAGHRRLVLRRRRPCQSAPGLARLRARGAARRARASSSAARRPRSRATGSGFVGAATARRSRVQSPLAPQLRRRLGAAAWRERFGEAAPLTAIHPGMAVTEPVPRFMDVNVGVEGGGIYGRQTARGNCVMGGSRGAANGCALRRAHGARHRRAVRPHGHALPAARARARDPLLERRRRLAARPPSGRRPEPDARRSLLHAFGFCGAGFQIGPAVGEALAEIVHHGRAACRSTRFPSPASPHADRATASHPSLARSALT